MRTIVKALRITNIKPPALCYIDDRAFRFDGRFPTVKQVEVLGVPWWQKAMAVAMNDIGDNLAQALFNAEYCKQRALSMADDFDDPAVQELKALAAEARALNKWKAQAAQDPRGAMAALSQAKERDQSAQTHLQKTLENKTQAQQALLHAKSAGADDRQLIPLEIAS